MQELQTGSKSARGNDTAALRQICVFDIPGTSCNARAVNSAITRSSGSMSNVCWASSSFPSTWVCTGLLVMPTPVGSDAPARGLVPGTIIWIAHDLPAHDHVRMNVQDVIQGRAAEASRVVLADESGRTLPHYGVQARLILYQAFGAR